MASVMLARSSDLHLGIQQLKGTQGALQLDLELAHYMLVGL